MRGYIASKCDATIGSIVNWRSRNRNIDHRQSSWTLSWSEAMKMTLKSDVSKYIYIYVWSFMNHTTLLFYASIRHIIIRIKTILSVFYTENKAFIWVVIHGLRRGGGDRAGCLVCYRYLRVRWQDEKCLIRFQINIEWCTLVIYRLFLYLELYLCILRYLRILD